MIFGALSSSVGHALSKPTSFFGVKLWIAVLICIGLLTIFLLSIVLACRYCRLRHRPIISYTSKPIISNTTSSSMNRRLLSRNAWDHIELNIDSSERQMDYSAQLVTARPGPLKSNSRATDFGTTEVGRSIEYCMREIDTATNGFAYENLIGRGNYGVVYRGLLYDHTRVAIKKLICNRCTFCFFLYIYIN